MDNGQKGQNSSDNSFFAPGVGDASASQNISGQETNVNLNSDQVNWTPERDNRNIGNKAIFSSEETSIEGIEGTMPPTEALGEITDVDQPATTPEQPAQSEQPVQPGQPEEIKPVIDEELIRTDGDRIAKSALKQVYLAEEKLRQTGDICGFYEEARRMMEENLRNSYNREVGA